MRASASVPEKGKGKEEEGCSGMTTRSPAHADLRPPPAPSESLSRHQKKDEKRTQLPTARRRLFVGMPLGLVVREDVVKSGWGSCESSGRKARGRRGGRGGGPRGLWGGKQSRRELRESSEQSKRRKERGEASASEQRVEKAK